MFLGNLHGIDTPAQIFPDGLHQLQFLTKRKLGEISYSHAILLLLDLGPVNLRPLTVQKPSA